ncbi:uncharacterized protein LOC26515213 [Drosophila ananassae]|uniref:uncharacterized protein LOC26515213 n=1 Tax=Drosophila ananassae TaxID=7217 RepID=UPI001CFF8F52|nr:uncharacterized protein LOC26515213 [Drosophila ananassae]
MTHQGIYNYFSKINSISEKISDDINSVKSTYSKDDWINLSWVEQEKILNKHLINREIYIKYFKTELCSPLQTIPKKIPKKNHIFWKNNDSTYYYNGQDLRTYVKQNVGLKELHDEIIENCRDEHSFPFSYRTESQINMPAIICGAGIFTEPSKSSSVTIKINDSRNKINDAYNLQKENFKMENCNGSLHSLSKSHHFTFPSQRLSIDDWSDDESVLKNTCQDENVKLLTREVKIPQGFDFLSNW